MGKAKRQLNNERKAVFAEINDYYSVFTDTGIVKIINAEETEEFKINELAWNIREMLFEYVHTNAYPLCEYLDIDNIINYIKWTVKPKS